MWVHAVHHLIPTFLKPNTHRQQRTLLRAKIRSLKSSRVSRASSDGLRYISSADDGGDEENHGEDNGGGAWDICNCDEGDKAGASEWVNPRSRVSPIAYRDSEKYLKKYFNALIGRTHIKAALNKLDKLTQQEVMNSMYSHQGRSQGWANRVSEERSGWYAQKLIWQTGTTVSEKELWFTREELTWYHSEWEGTVGPERTIYFTYTWESYCSTQDNSVWVS